MLPLGWESLVGCIYLVGSLVALSVAFVGCENEYYFIEELEVHLGSADTTRNSQCSYTLTDASPGYPKG